MLTDHQRLHVEALLRDAADLRTGAERNRVAGLAAGMLDGTIDWPDPYLEPSEIHDWIEEPDRRSDFLAAIAQRKAEVLG